MQPITHEYIAGRVSLHDDTQYAAAICNHELHVQLQPTIVDDARLYAENGARVTPQGEPTCKRCLARRRCDAGTATDADRMLLAVDRPKHKDKLGPIESMPCPVHKGSRYRRRLKWTAERSPTKADIERVESRIEWAHHEAEPDKAAEWDNVIDVLCSIKRDMEAGPTILAPVEVIVEACMICKMGGRRGL